MPAKFMSKEEKEAALIGLRNKIAEVDKKHKAAAAKSGKLMDQKQSLLVELDLTKKARVSKPKLALSIGG
jgi:hypothetical protein